MISRVADHCFWFGRYLERAENTARVLSVTADLAVETDLPRVEVWMPVIVVAGERPAFIERFGVEAASDGEVVQNYMTWDENNLTSIRRSIEATRENARSIREVVSLEAWATINELYLWMADTAARDTYLHDRVASYRHVRDGVQLCLALLRSTMLHDTPLDFIWLGLMLESVGQTARILDVHHHTLTGVAPRHQVVDTAVWLALLRACSGFEPFMKVHRGSVSGPAVASFLVLDPKFPRSIRYGLTSAFQLFCRIRPVDRTELPGVESYRRLDALAGSLQDKRAETLDLGTIHDLLTHIVDAGAAVCDSIGRELLSYRSDASVETTQ